MPDINDFFPSKYIKAADLKGNRVKVTISHVTGETMRGETKPKPILYFIGKDRGLVLNPTNAKKIAELAATDDYSLWGGLEIKLYPSTTEYKGEETACIRIEGIPGAKPTGEPMPSAGENEVPF